jgi:Right handed beta helix region
MQRLVSLLAAAVMLGCGIAAAQALTPGPASTTGAAAAPAVLAADPLPILFVAPNGSDSSPCTQLLPCLTWNRAYQLAPAGSVIGLLPGTYPSQTISNRTLNGTITIRPVAGASVTVNGRILISTHGLAIDGGQQLGTNETNQITVLGTNGAEPAVDFGRGNNSPQVTGNTVEDVHTRNIYVDDASTGNVFTRGEIGPSTMQPTNLCGDLVVSGDSQITVEYSLIHDNRGTGCGSAHIDALDLNPASSPPTVIRGNRIWWCGTQCIFTGDPGSLVIENNMIEETEACGSGCDAPQEIAVMGTSVIRDNTVDGDVGLSCNSCNPPRPGDANVYGNVFLSSIGCTTFSNSVTTVRCDHNVFASGSGGTNPKTCVPRLANGSLWTNTDRNADFHLSATDTCAANAGDPARFPPLDLDEQARTSPPDAGADEIASSPPVTTTTDTTGTTTTQPTTTQTVPTTTTAPTTTSRLCIKHPNHPHCTR